jgi:manganese/zinc/iron transport system permease protein
VLFLAQQPRGGSITDVSDTWPTFQQVLDAMLLRAGYNTTVVIVGTTLLGIAAGIIGVFGLLRKRALMADALAHATLPGIGLVFIIATELGFNGRSLPLLLFGGAMTGVLGVASVQLILRHTRLKEDAAIGIVLSVFFGAGVVLLSYIQTMTSGNQGGLQTFIYGQTAAMSVGDARLMGGIALTAVVATFLLFKEFSLVGFNDAFAKVGGWPVAVIDLMMMGLVVIVTVAGLQAVGLILVVATLIIPPVAARFWTERLRTLVILAAVIGGLSGYFGSIVSALLPRKPAGSVIVLTSGVFFILSMFLAPARGVLAMAIRRFRLRLRIAGDHVLEAAYETDEVSLTPQVLSLLARMRGWSWWFRRLVLLTLKAQQKVKQMPDGMGIALLDRGWADGARVSRNHKLWEQYLISYADIAPSHVDWSVDQVEHVLSDDLVTELEEALRARGITVPEGAP